MAVKEGTVALKVMQNKNILKSDLKYQRLYHRACNPPEKIVRATEGKEIDESKCRPLITRNSVFL